MLRRISVPIGLTSLVLLAGCSVGPDYVPPSVPQTSTYKEATGNWKKAEPQETIARGNWYSVFHDSELDNLEARAFQSNQTLREAVARVSEARSVARQSEADFYPTIDFDAEGSRQRISPNDGATVAQSGSAGGFFKPQAETYNSATVTPFDLSYELDIWGKVRRAFEA
jgi:outer membrane protein TolC